MGIYLISVAYYGLIAYLVWLLVKAIKAKEGYIMPIIGLVIAIITIVMKHYAR